VVVIENGSVVQTGEPDDIRRRPATPYVAALAGTNLLAGSVRNGSILLRDHPHSLTVADSETTGEVLVTIHPRAIALHGSAPAGSPRNVWPTTVDLVEPLGDTTRVVLGSPVPLAVDITPASAAELGLRSGTAVWVSVKATEIELTTV
jgi:molybdate transport system ATP-binding protein